MKSMQQLEGLMRKAMQTWQMIEANDKVCVAVSGGKDSVALAVGLAHLSSYYELPYTITLLTLDPCFSDIETDYSLISDFFEQQGLEHTIIRTNIGRVVFDLRKEKNPCALCAKMRRGALHTAAKQLGCNKIAMGHHLDDAVETFYMNLFGEGRIGCFSPVTWLSQKEITLIRPLVLAQERDILRAVQEKSLPVVKNRCPVDGDTARAEAKRFVAERALLDKAFCQKTLHAMRNANLDGW